MKFFLNVNIPKYNFQFNHSQKVFMAGSCFSEHISEKMLQNGFHVTSNPWGILFNPLSLALMTQKMLQPTYINDAVIPLQRDGLWYSLNHHSQVNGNTEEELFEQVNQLTLKASLDFNSSDIYIVTFGTSFIYEFKERQHAIVANCQKLPNTSFAKRLLGISEIVDAWSNLILHIPDKKIIFTVSPVRHSKDGLVENNISKSILILAIQQLIQKFPEQCFYFPSYEIVLDELRDYRFYKDDLVHPNEMAVNYVWERWCETWYDSTTLEKSKAFHQLYLFAHHRPLNGNIVDHYSKLREKRFSLKKRYKDLNYSRLNL
ncbi:MAG TPA: GSCFA domain-containing protein [Chitinophagales bacterium]|nr:GSCFA domain-containing protein [Chitinophagales bacterium]